MAFPTGYTKYQEVTIDHTKVSADLTDYVVYVNLADLVKAGADIFDTCRSDGGDIRATKSDGTTQLATELVAIDTTAKTGELHVKFTGTLSSSTDTIIRIWYNGTDTALATSDTYGRNAVWSGYVAKWHFNESSGNATDSTDGKVLTNTNVTYTTGQIGNTAEYNSASSEGLNTTSYTPFNFGVSSPFSFTMWVKRNSSATSNQMLVAHQNYGANWVGYNVMINTVSSVETVKVALTNTSTAGFSVATTTGLSTTLTKVDITYDGSGSYTGVKIYFDGVSQSVTNTGTTVTGTMTNTERFQVGVWGPSNQESRFQGLIDELGCVSSTLSANWLTTEYNNQNSPSTFYSAGSEQGGGGGGYTPTPILHMLQMI